MSRGTFVVKSIVFVAVSSLGYICCFLTVFQLAAFLFRDGFGENRLEEVQACRQEGVLGDQTHAPSTRPYPYAKQLVSNSLLVAAFIIQHSLMACRLWKVVIRWSGLDVVDRSLYILGTCAALQFLISNWRPIDHGVILWSFDVNRTLVRALFSLTAFLGWLGVAGPALVLDFAELLGIKQVYYYVMGLVPPVQVKSSEYQRLFTNCRHPVLTGLLLILWAIPVMTLSRFVLALLFTAYTMFGHSLTYNDYNYMCLQHQLKRRSYNNSTSLIG